MALTDEERHHLDDLADELAAELACSDPYLVHALTYDLTLTRHRERLLIQLLVVVSVPLMVAGVVLVQPMLFAAGGFALLAGAMLGVATRRRRKFRAAP